MAEALRAAQAGAVEQRDTALEAAHLRQQLQATASPLEQTRHRLEQSMALTLQVSVVSSAKPYIEGFR